MAENGKHVKDTLAFSVFFVYSNRNNVLLTSDLLPIISPVVCQLSVNIVFGLHAHDISTSWLTSNQWYIGQQITVSKNLFLNHTELQIRGSYEDNSKIIFLIFQRKHMLWPLIRTVSSRLDETVLMMGHKIRFYEEIWIIIYKLSLLLLLIWSPDHSRNNIAEYFLSLTIWFTVPVVSKIKICCKQETADVEYS